MKILTSLLFLLPLSFALPREAAPMPAPMSAPTPRSAITPFLWFEKDAEAALHFYLSVFDDGAVLEENRWGPGGPAPEGSLMTARLRIRGQELVLFGGGPFQRFNPSFSLVVSCADQAEIDRTWAALTADGGKPGRCGWLEDRFGLSWQVVPHDIGALLGGSDPAAAARAGAALMQMGKLDVAALRTARDG